jgi:hypothetical protein
MVRGILNMIHVTKTALVRIHILLLRLLRHRLSSAAAAAGSDTALTLAIGPEEIGIGMIQELAPCKKSSMDKQQMVLIFG